ncbi:hypothetical protein [Microcoleus sp. D3_18a_C4]|uniref:hypothetical protein n=1 Tax=unclassified Microcoleus TaxID=2642155 RepID=UPI002FD20E08
MLDKIWRFLKQLIQRLLGTTPPKIQPTPPQPRPTLTDAEYEAKLMELLEGVNEGWGRGDVVGFLIAKRIKNGDLAAWLRRLATRFLEGENGGISMKAAHLEIGVFRQEALLLRGRRKEEEGKRQKKCFYKYEMLPQPYSLPQNQLFVKQAGKPILQNGAT